MSSRYPAIVISMNLDSAAAKHEISPAAEAVIADGLAYLSRVSLDGDTLYGEKFRISLTNTVLGTTNAVQKLMKRVGLPTYEHHWEATIANRELEGAMNIQGNFGFEHVLHRDLIWQKGNHHRQGGRHEQEPTEFDQDLYGGVQPLLTKFVAEARDRFAHNKHATITFAPKNGEPTLKPAERYDVEQNFVRLLIPIADYSKTEYSYQFADLTSAQYERLIRANEHRGYLLSHLLHEQPNAGDLQVLAQLGIKLQPLDHWHDTSHPPLITLGLTDPSLADHPLHHIIDSKIGVSLLISMERTESVPYHPRKITSTFGHTTVAGVPAEQYLQDCIVELTTLPNNRPHRPRVHTPPPPPTTLPIRDPYLHQHAQKLEAQQAALWLASCGQDAIRQLAQVTNLAEIRWESLGLPPSLKQTIKSYFELLSENNLITGVERERQKQITLKLLGTLYSTRQPPLTPVSPDTDATDQVEMTTPGNILYPFITDVLGALRRFQEPRVTYEADKVHDFIIAIDKLLRSPLTGTSNIPAAEAIDDHARAFTDELTRARGDRARGIEPGGVASLLAYAANAAEQKLRTTSSHLLPPQTAQLTGTAQYSLLGNMSPEIATRCESSHFRTGLSSPVKVGFGEQSETVDARYSIDNPLLILEIIGQIKDPTFNKILSGYLGKSKNKNKEYWRRWLEKRAAAVESDDEGLTINEKISATNVPLLLESAGKDPRINQEVVSFASELTIALATYFADKERYQFRDYHITEFKNIAVLEVQKKTLESLIAGATAAWTTNFIERNRYITNVLAKFSADTTPQTPKEDKAIYEDVATLEEHDQTVDSSQFERQTDRIDDLCRFATENNIDPMAVCIHEFLRERKDPASLINWILRNLAQDGSLARLDARIADARL